MVQILKAFSRAFNDLFQFKVLWIVIWPTLAASMLWLTLGIIFWNTVSGWITEGLLLIGMQNWLESINTEWIATFFQVSLYFILFLLLVVVTTLIITAIFSMPALIRLVASRYYPELKYEHGGNMTGNLINAMIALVVFIIIWIITIPLWIIGIGVVVPFIAAAYLNQQLFRYDALSEHANRQELKVLLGTDRKLLWSLGLLTGSLQLIPIVNLFAPVLAALAFIHFELSRLARIRSKQNQL
ncbi:MAG: EI24 domain-containing protein [Nitrosomonas sp.]|nr:EI24 domain-containing protein [Nitrosomonas sp.]